MSEDQFTKLFKYIQHMKLDIDDRFDAVDKKFSVLQSAVDAIAKRQETEEHERLAMSSQMNRFEDWRQSTEQRLRKAGL